MSNQSEKIDTRLGAVNDLVTGKKHTLVVRPDEDWWIELELLDDEGQPVEKGDQKYKVVGPDGKAREGQLKEGRARIEKIPRGLCKVSFPDLDKGDWDRAPSSSPG